MRVLRGEALDASARRHVRAATVEWLRRAECLFGLDHRPIPVLFDLRGRAAGMYRVVRHERVIRYNPFIFARWFDHGLQTTVPHEVAHYITDRLYGLAHIRPHGREWRGVMLALGVTPRATSSLDLGAVAVRRQRRFAYHCACRTHQLSTCRHNRVVAGTAAYRCRRCNGELVMA